jgi:SAM-dependent methyltransferase
MTVAAYDAYADWYAQYLTTDAREFTARAQDLLAQLLGPGQGVCLDVCCGNGFYSPVLRSLGWSPVGIDISAGQLAYARGRLPVARADAARLPVAGDCVPAAVCMCAHTDLPDYQAVVADVARVLRPGGRFVHLGVHPCFVGAFADHSDRPRIVIDQRYADRSRSFDAWTPHGVRARVGAWHVPLADLLNAASAVGLTLEHAAEHGSGGVPDLFGFTARKCGSAGGHR